MRTHMLPRCYRHGHCTFRGGATAPAAYETLLLTHAPPLAVPRVPVRLWSLALVNSCPLFRAAPVKVLRASRGGHGLRPGDGHAAGGDRGERGSANRMNSF